MRLMRVRASWVLLGLLVGAISSSYAFAQFGQDFFGGMRGLRGEQGDPAEIPPPNMAGSDVTACHMLYTSVRREPSGAGWRTGREVG